MKLTLWLLNRITQWEVNHPGELGHALAGTGARHDVRLGRRILATTPTEAGTVEFTVNNTEPSFRSELMHEGYQQSIDAMRKSAYDEYFMPTSGPCGAIRNCRKNSAMSA